MILLTRKAAVLFLLGSLASACVFDGKGLPAAGDQGTQDLTDAVRLDKPRLDSTPLAVCQEVPAPTDNVCAFEGGDSVGASGTCVAGGFKRSRFCFSLAPCQGGLCRPICTNDCRSTGCGAAEVCTALFTSASVVKHCCVDPTAKNGKKSVQDSCTKNEECVSGLCNTKAGNCFKPCFNKSQCSQGMNCILVQVNEGKLTFKLYGCVKGAVDAGPDSVTPDIGVDSALPDVGVDSALPDSGVDSALPDAGVDSAAPDAALPDAALPDAKAVDAGSALDSATPADAAPILDQAVDTGIDS